MIPFNKPAVVGNELKYVEQAARSLHLSGDGPFMKECHQWFVSQYGAAKALMVPSCTHALEMAALLLDIQDGDEVIMPSYTFVSTANAFVLRGATIVFVDVDPMTMNMDIDMIEGAITTKTKVIVPVHYGGIACDMKRIMDIAKKYDLWVVEDAAQAIGSYIDQNLVGTKGHISALSFHETKNIQCGEGGMLLINDERLVERAEILREKGTNRSRFFRGQVDKYTWVDVGSSYLPSELTAAYLLGQLESIEIVTKRRVEIWNQYDTSGITKNTEWQKQCVPAGIQINGHIFYLKLKDLEERTLFIDFMKERGVQCVFHYIPLHSSPAGIKFGRFHGIDKYTTKESERLVRLPIHLGMTDEDIEYVITCVKDFKKG